MTLRCISIRCLSRRAALLVLETSQSMSKSIRGARWENDYPSRNLFGWRTATGTVLRSPAVENALKLHAISGRHDLPGQTRKYKFDNPRRDCDMHVAG